MEKNAIRQHLRRAVQFLMNHAHCICACIYFLAVPLTITTSSSGSSLLRLLTIPIAGFFLLSLFFYKENLQINSVHCFLMIYLFSVVSTLFVDRSNTSILYVRGYIETIALLFCVTLRKYTEGEIKALEIVQLLLLCILIYLGLSSDNADYAGAYGDRTTIKIFGNVSDPNYFTGFFLFPIAVALKYIAENKFRWLCVALVCLGSYVVMLSGSRGGLLALAGVILSFVLINAKSHKTRIASLFILVTASFIFWAVVIPMLPQDVAQRFSIQAVIESRGTYRGDIWISMLNTIKESSWELLLGRGITAQHRMMVAGRMQEVVAHNHFIQIVYNGGFFGAFCFMAFALAAVFRNIKKRGYISAALLGTFVLMLTLSINPSIKSFWNLLMYAALPFCIVNSSERS